MQELASLFVCRVTAENSAQCAKTTTGADGQKACILRTDEKHDAIWHYGAGKG